MNRNKIILITGLAVIIGLVAVLCTGCNQNTDMSDVDSIGRVYIVGNTPVTQAVYRDDSGQYQIDNGYQNLSGCLVHITGDITGDGIYGAYLSILSVEIVH